MYTSAIITYFSFCGRKVFREIILRVVVERIFKYIRKNKNNSKENVGI